MEKDKETTHTMNPWRPEQDLMRLAILGKLAEELGEAQAIVARCIIQGIDEREPITKRYNREALEDELADVYASMQLCCDHFELNTIRMRERQDKKRKWKQSWHEKVRAMLPWPKYERRPYGDGEMK